MKSIFILLLSSFLFFNGFTQSGFLDLNFGDSGKVISNTYEGFAYTSLIQTDGKILVGGSGTYYKNNELLKGTLLTRYNTNGSQDLTFADSGRSISMLGDTGTSSPVIHSMALQSDGKIICLSPLAILNGTGGFGIMRFNTDGTPDKTFGTNGIIVTNISGGADAPYDIALLPDGRIIIAGDLDIYGNSLESFVACYTNNGSLDKSFGNNGVVTVYLSTPIHVKSVAITADSKIVVSGAYWNYPKNFVFRYNNNGTLDLSFGNEGMAEMQFEKNTTNTVNDMAVSDDQKIVITGVLYLKTGEATIVVSRFTSDGKPDSSFGANGYAYTEYEGSNAFGNSVVIQEDGKIISAGDYSNNNQALFTLLRYTKTGTLDSSFGINGIQNTNFFGSDLGTSVNLQKDNKIVLAGYSQLSGNENNNYVDIARYNNDLTQKQIIITKLRHWIQHHNGFTWDANSSIDNYVVQRSYDGIHFSSIARISSSSNSNYTYQDPLPLTGTNNYRLQTTSINGTVNYSNVLAVANSDIKIAPNPATNSLHIDGLSSIQKTKLTVVDFAGNIKLQTAVNRDSYNLSIASLKAGNYLLKIETKDDVVTKSFVKE